MSWKTRNVSVSSHCDLKSSYKHNFRIGNQHTSNIDVERMNENVYLGITDDSLELHELDFEKRNEVYNPKECFFEFYDEQLEEYNSHQKKSRQKTMEEYYKETKPENRMKEFILQIGKYDDLEELSIDEIEEMKQTQLEITQEYISTFEERNPHMKLIGATIHKDEMSQHCHLMAMPFTDDGKRGLSTQPSWMNALRQDCGMTREEAREKGIPKSEYNFFGKWREREDAYIDELLKEHGLNREYVESRDKYYDVKEYREMKEARDSIKEEFKHLNKRFDENEKKLEQTKHELAQTKHDAIEFQDEVTKLRRQTEKATQEAQEANELATEMEEKAKSMVQNVNVSTSIEDKKLYTKRDIQKFKENEKNLQVALNLKDEKIKDRDKQIDDIKSQKYKLESENYELKQELKAKDRIIQSLNEKVDYFKCRISGIEAVADALEISQFRAIFIGTYTADIGKAIQVNNTELFRETIKRVAEDADIEITESMRERINDTCTMMQKRKALENKEEYNQIDVEYSESIEDIKRFDNQAEQSQNRLHDANFNVLCEALSVYDINECKKEEIVSEALKSNKDMKIEDIHEFVERKYAIVNEDTINTKYKSKQLDDAVFKKVELEDFKDSYKSTIHYNKNNELVFDSQIETEYTSLVNTNVNIESKVVAQRIKIDEMEALRKKRQQLEAEEYRINKLKQEHEKESNRSRGRERSL